MSVKNINEQPAASIGVASGVLLGIATRCAERLGQKQWSMMDDLSDADFREEILPAVTEAYLKGLLFAEALCIQHAKTGNPEGWTDSVSRDCAAIIKGKSAEAMPNIVLDHQPAKTNP